MKKLLITAITAASVTLAAPAWAEEEHEFLGIFQAYLEIADRFVTLANRKDATVFFAIEGIVEIHEERGNKAEAIPLVREALALYPDDLAVRNIIRFKLRDLYRETGQADMALAELRTLLEENK